MRNNIVLTRRNDKKLPRTVTAVWKGRRKWEDHRGRRREVCLKFRWVRQLMKPWQCGQAVQIISWVCGEENRHRKQMMLWNWQGMDWGQGEGAQGSSGVNASHWELRLKMSPNSYHWRREPSAYSQSHLQPIFSSILTADSWPKPQPQNNTHTQKKQHPAIQQILALSTSPLFGYLLGTIVRSSLLIIHTPFCLQSSASFIMSVYLAAALLYDMLARNV